MPQSAIRSGCVDFVLPPEEIARELARIGRHPYLGPGRQASRPEPAPRRTSSRTILALLRAAPASISPTTGDDHPAADRAGAWCCTASESLADYAELCESDPAELEALYQDILINVTSFFRDPEAFEALKREVFPEILRPAIADEPIRIWVPGCSTGEEAYSLAIALLEFLGDEPAGADPDLRHRPHDDVSLEKARAGALPREHRGRVSPERLRRFFTRDGRQLPDQQVHPRPVRLRPAQRGHDPPFSRLDLISCRNVLIYLEPRLQKRVMPMFHYALKPGGFLLLGRLGDGRRLHRPVRRGGQAAQDLREEGDGACGSTRTFGAGDLPARAAGAAGAAAGRHGRSRLAARGRPHPARALRPAPACWSTTTWTSCSSAAHTGPYLEPAPGEASLTC